MILAIGNLKGGVGKTTIALNIIITLAKMKRDVLLIDAERSALDFTDLRAANHDAHPGYTAVGLRGTTIRTQVRRLAPKYDDIVIDIGGEDETGSLRAALTVSDTILIPVKPRTLDVWRTQQTAAIVTEAREVNDHLRAITILNEADPSGQDNEASLAELRLIAGLEICPVMIGRRKAFPNAQAAGYSVLEHRQDPKAMDELRGLVKFLYSYTNDIAEVAYGNREETGSQSK
jgi:chromosome partitioning protein